MTRQPPWPHQLAALEFEKKHPQALFEMGMRCGKTYSTILIWEYNGSRLVLVMCPVCVISVWESEIVKFGDPDYGWQVCALTQRDGTVKDKAVKLAKAVDRARANAKPLMVVINYDSAWREPLASLLASLPFDDVECDESQRIKAPRGNASLFADKLVNGPTSRRQFNARPKLRKLLLTGTPMKNGPIDIFGQFRFLDQSVFGLSFTRFRATYCQLETGHSRTGSFPKIVGYKNLEHLASLIAPTRYEVSRSVLSLTKPSHQRIDVHLTPKSRRAYDQLQKEYATLIDNQLVTAANGMVSLLRVQQMTGGFVSVDPDPLEGLHGSSILEIGTEKESIVEDWMDDFDEREPIVMVARFRHDLDVIHRICARLGRTSLELSGRKKQLEAWKRGEADVLAVQIQAGGVGVDMSRACFMGVFSMGFSLGDYEQVICRIHSTEQKRPVAYTHFIAKDTADEAVYGALRQKRNVVEEVIGYLRNPKEAVVLAD